MASNGQIHIEADIGEPQDRFEMADQSLDRGMKRLREPDDLSNKSKRMIQCPLDRLPDLSIVPDTTPRQAFWIVRLRLRLQTDGEVS